MDPIFEEAMERFDKVYRDALALDVRDPSAMALATADANSRPSVRIVTFEGIFESGFVFFTSIESGKGHQLQSNPRAALCFHWDTISEQIIIEAAAAPSQVRFSFTDRCAAAHSARVLCPVAARPPGRSGSLSSRGQ